MNIVVKKEYNNYDEMVKYIEDNKLVDVDYRFAMVALLTDKDGRIILQRRGDEARDAHGMLADIGGAFEDRDGTFRDGLYREIHEEVGNQADISIETFVGGSIKTIYDPRTEKDVNWLFLAYKCKYNGGILECNEPGKCVNYEYYKSDELNRDDMSETSKFFWNYYFNEYNKCYSYVMGIDKGIKKLGKEFVVKEDDGDYEVTFTKDKAEKWEKFIEDNMNDGFWNEYIIDDEIRFIFKEDGIIKKYVLNKDNNQEILEKCRYFAESNFDSIRNIYENTPFYKDKIDGIVFFD